MVISDLKSKTVFLDTAPLIYFIEGHSTYQSSLSNLFTANERGDFTFISTTITLLEVLVKPLKDGKTKLVDQYRNILLNAPGIEIYDITSSVAVKAAELRAKYNLRTPDSLQIACCLEMNADYFLTNDLRLNNITEIHCITPLEIL